MNRPLLQTCLGWFGGWQRACGLLLNMAAGAFFRLYKLDQRGVPDSDSASYCLDARLFYAGGKLLAHKWGLYNKETTDDILRYLALRAQSSYGKPGDAFFRATTMWIFGDTLGAAHLALAIFGIATIPVLFLFSQRLFQNVWVSLTAAGLLAISHGHVEYSRGLKSETDGAFFLLLAVWCYYEGALQRARPLSSYRRIWIAGLLAGQAFACKNRLVFIPPLFALFIAAEFILLRREMFECVVNFTRLLTGFLIMVVVWEFPYHFAMLAAKNAGFDVRALHTFWDSLVRRNETAGVAD